MTAAGNLKLGKIYVAAVITVAFAALAASILRTPFIRPGADWTAIALFAPFVIAGEHRPIAMPRREGGEINISTMFAYAILLCVGAVPAIATLAVASLSADLVRRKPWWKCLFNIAQYASAVFAAREVARLVSASTTYGDMSVTGWRDLSAIIAGSLAFTLANLAITKVAIALFTGRQPAKYLFEDLRFQVMVTEVTLLVSPILVAAAERSALLVPLLILPMLTLERSAIVSVDRDHQALHDSLTNLPNRALFRDRVTTALRAVVARQDHVAAVMIIDLDRFKEVNDTLGHHIGDLLLQEVGARLVACVPTSATVARLGGDEFGIVVPDVGSAGRAEMIANQLIGTLAQPVLVNGLRLDVPGSIGIALAPEHGVEVDVLLQRADVAMYKAKESHCGTVIYRADDDQHSVMRLAMVGELKKAIEEHQLVLHYQPKETTNGAFAGVEALVRWDHPQWGVVMPDEFIALAEATGLMAPLTRLVLTEALAQLKRWSAAGLETTVAVNVSARSLYDPQFLAEVLAVLDQFEITSDRLTLELTESTILDEPARAMTVLTELSASGVRLAIDDFGTGYSSLAYLRRLPVHEIKIDRSFVTDMARDGGNTVIVQSTIELARNLGLSVTAEGVEDEYTRRLLGQMRCDTVQGYLLSRPVPAQELFEWAQSRNHCQSPPTCEPPERHYTPSLIMASAAP